MTNVGAFLGSAQSRLLPASVPFRFFATAAALHVALWLAAPDPINVHETGDPAPLARDFEAQDIDAALAQFHEAYDIERGDLELLLRLGERSNAKMLLLVITDGKPNDLDHYEGRFGVEDTRRATQEARRLGQSVFRVAIDAHARASVRGGGFFHRFETGKTLCRAAGDLPASGGVTRAPSFGLDEPHILEPRSSFSKDPIWRRRIGTISASNHGFLLSQILLRGLG
jgi:hypothetical protein